MSAALQYAAKGWRVIPLHSMVDGSCTCEKPDCTSPAKHPLTSSGVHDAVTDPRTIERWWEETKGLANVGIATGQDSGLVVVDVDAKSGGLGTLVQLEQTNGTLPTTPTANTGGGGRHYFFHYPEGHAIGNRAGIQPGIDIRGEGGYVVAAPSAHASGSAYAWSVPPDEPLAEVPAWLLDLMLGKPVASTDVQPPLSHTATMLVVQSAMDDLGTHPGAAEGQRNDVLCRLVGAHLARGEDSEYIATLAAAWAERCSPPMPESEVARTIKSLADKHERTTLFVRSHGDGDAEFENMPLPAQPTWPKLDAAALHGLAGEVVQLFAPQTEADPVAILVSLLVVVGSIVGRRPFFPVEGDKHHANLFAVLVGDSSRGRKGTSLGRTISLVEAVDPAWTKDCMTTGLTSGEGLIYAVRDAVETMEVVKEKGYVVGYESVIRDHGVDDKRLLIIESEFAQALRVLKREGNTLSPVIRSAWESGNLKTLAKNSPTKATDGHISILAHITRPELSQYLSDVELFNGFANRFVWPVVRRSKRLPHGGQPLDLKPLQNRLAKACATASKIECMARSAAASALWSQLYPHLTAEDRAGLYAAATGRAEAQTLRLSMLYALLDGSPVIDIPHLLAAYALWDYCDASAKIIFGQAETNNPLEKLLLETIRKMPGAHRKALYKTTGGHIPAEAMVGALAGLRDRGLVRCELAATGGRPAERWFPCEHKKISDVALSNAGLSSFAGSEPPPATQEVANMGAGAVEPDAAGEADAPTQAVAGAMPDASVITADCPAPADNGHSSATAAATDLSLADLFNALNQVGGRLVRQENAIIIDADGKVLPAGVEAALAIHQEALAQLVPFAAVAKAEPSPAPEAGEKKGITTEEFFARLHEMKARGKLRESLTTEESAKDLTVAQIADPFDQAKPSEEVE
ncbi:MAG: bifunctional DNA primase/polymerase [Thermoguttaceae bacterium]